MSLQVGQTLNNRYRIIHLLKAGGFGAVYTAWDNNLGITCAVKENLENTPEAQNQFMREARMLALLNHPNLPRVIDHFIIPAQGQYLVMDFIEGEDLEALRMRSGGALAEAQVLPWIEQVCDALIYLHSQNPPIIHRDIKPANIRITPQGKAVLVDFGIAKQSHAGQKTTIGARAITPGYSPPEQYTGVGTDQRADVYSLGATLYTLLTGLELPESINRMITRHGTQPPHIVRPNISMPVSMAVMRAVDPQVDIRFPTVSEFKRNLHPARKEQSWVKYAVAVAVLALLLIAGRLLFPSHPPAAPTASTPIGTVNSPASIQKTDTPSPAVFPKPTSSPEKDSVVRTNTVPAVVPSLTSAYTQTAAVPSGPQVNEKDQARLIYIPAGEFIMGLTQDNINFLCQVDGTCDADIRDTMSHSMPEHKVKLSEYWMYQYEVTNAQYRACVKAGGCITPHSNASHTHKDYFVNQAYDNYPVINVDWFQADQYCKWAGARLPTEAEWEKAARGTDGSLWPWGSTPPTDNRANLASTNLQTIDDTTEVGAFPAGASSYQVMDMAGNVYEWAADWYATYYFRDAPYENPQGPDQSSRVDGKTDALRVVKGGSCGYGTWQASSGIHDSWEPNKSGTGVGFRCALSNLP